MNGTRRLERRGRAQRGFTLIELMVALTLGGMAVASIYYIGRGNTHFFHQQYRASNTMSRLRLAMEQVKRDLRRAGYLATPNAVGPNEASCGVPPAPLLAVGRNLSGIVAHTSGFGAGLMDPGEQYENTLRSDTITLLGNYATSSQYPGIRISPANPSRIFISRAWYAFRRDFTVWDTGAVNGNFTEAFAAGRPVRILTRSRRKHFTLVDSPPTINGLNDPSIILTHPVPGTCRADVNGGSIAPLMFLRYGVVDAADSAQLRRQEWDIAAGAAVGQDSVVLEHVVEFDVTFVAANTLGAQPDLIQWNGGGGLDALTDPGARVEDLRLARISLAARTPTLDPTFRPPTAPNADAVNDPLQPFPRFVTQPDGDVTGAARVRRLQADVFLGNMVVDN